MKKKDKILKGVLNSTPEKQIYLNINHLKDGNYILKIIYRNKVIKKTKFNKNQRK